VRFLAPLIIFKERGEERGTSALLKRDALLVLYYMYYMYYKWLAFFSILKITNSIGFMPKELAWYN
jgi:hypothetical protein